MELKIRKTHLHAKTPTYATIGAACFDLMSCEWVNIRPGEWAIINTGLSFEVPEDHAMMVYGRSGLAAKGRISLGNCVGVIDSDYRGDVKVILRNDGLTMIEIRPYDRIAQAMVIPVPKVQFVEADLSETDRGAGGFGSTGA